MDKFDALSAAIGNELETSTNPIVTKLQKALCDELLASYQYWTCYQSSRGKGKADCDPEFKAHYEEEKNHAEKLMLRINELGGRPIPDPANWAECAPFGYTPIEDTAVKGMLEITIHAEENAIAYYKEFLQEVTAEVDPTTHRLIKQILSDEEEHLYDLKQLYADVFMADVENI